MPDDRSLHIMHLSPHAAMIPIRLVLYVSEELMADKGTTSRQIAELLVRDVDYGVEQRRVALGLKEPITDA